MYKSSIILCFVVCHVYCQDLHYQKIIQNAARFTQNKQPLMVEGVKGKDEAFHILHELQSLADLYKSKQRTLSDQHVKDINETLIKTYDVSSTCLDHVLTTVIALTTREEWAIRVVDSLGKIESGMLEGNINWLGSYDECLSIKGLEFNVTDPKEIFEGQYCLVGTLIQYRWIQIALCSPDSCNNRDLTEILYAAVSMLLPNTTIPLNVNCQTKEVDIDDRAIGAIVLFGFIFMCMMIGTGFDILVVQRTHSKNIPEPNTEKAPLLDHTKSPISNEDSGVLSKILLSFSVYTNGKKLLNTDQAEGSLTAVNGIRFLSMSWVILGHTYAFITNFTGNLIVEFPKLLSRWTFQSIANALVSVDTFFTLSGLLLTYLFLRGMEKSHGKMNWAMFYFHRFWRLTPVYMLVLFADVALSRYFADGPVWPKETGFEIDFCKDTWWTNLLYINNLVYSDKMCMAWSWYLANDMQFFVISPLLLVPLFYSNLLGIGVCCFFLLGTWITTGVLSTHYDLPASFYSPGVTGEQSNDYFQKYYITPYTRIGPYIVGIFTGYILYRTERGFKMNKIINLIGWAIATAVALAILYGLHDHIGNGTKLSTEVAALYNTVHRSLWGACVCWVIFSCARGYGGFVNTILSWKGFVPLSRLTYCAYLVHPLVMYVVYYSRRDMIHMSDITMIYYFFGNMVGAFAVALVVSLAFESPMMGLEKAILPQKKKS